MDDTIKDKRSSCQIFLSYTQADRKKVESLYDKLLKAGYKPWMDTNDILPGEKWGTSVKRAIKKSAFFLACLSINSVSKRGFLQKEIRYAKNIMEGMLDKDIYLIPVRLEECEVNENLKAIQWVNLYQKEGLDKLFEAIEEGIKRRKTEGNKKEQYNDKDTASHQFIEEGDSKKPPQNNIRELKGAGMEDHNTPSDNESGTPTNGTNKPTREGSRGDGYLRKILAYSKECQDRFEEAEKLAYGIFKDPEGRYVPLPFYTEHGIEHCQTVEVFLDDILSCATDLNKDFIPNSEEAMFLLSGAWIHDIGMMYGIFHGEQASDLANNPDYYTRLRNEHEIRTNRHIRNEWYLECHWSYEEKTILSNICHFHRKKYKIYDFVPVVITGKITGKPIRIKVIAALLRIADACHVDRSRVPGNLRALYDSLGMPADEVCFWGQPELISRVSFQHPDDKIVIKSLIPNPIDFKRGKFDFEEIIELVRKDIEEELKSVQTVLLQYTNTAFKEVRKEVNPLPVLDDEAPRRCLGIWPYFLKKPYSATEGASSLVQMLLFELAETQNFGDPCLRRISDMIGEVVRWRPYDIVVFKLQDKINKILSQGQTGSTVQNRLKVYLNKFLKNICANCNRMTERAIPLIKSEDVLFLYGYSINIVKFLEAIKRSHLGAVYAVDCRLSNAHLQFDPHENEQILEFLRKNEFKNNFIQLTQLSQILDDLGRTNTPRKIILGTHSVLKVVSENYLLCKEGSKGLFLIGRDGGAEILAFAETNKFFDIEKEEDIKSVAVNGFSYYQENGGVRVASSPERSGIQMDVIPNSLIDYLITEKNIYKRNKLEKIKKA